METEPMIDFKMVITIEYPNDAHSPETKEAIKFITDRLTFAAKLLDLNLEWDEKRRQPEGYFEQTNSYLLTGIAILSRQVKHVKTVVAFSKYLEGFAEILSIWKDAHISYYYPDSFQ